MIGLSSVQQKMRSMSTQADKLINSAETSTFNFKKKSRINNGRIIIVEGNIGVGKTTLACQLGRKLNYRIFLEPTSGNPYLKQFYEEPKKYALKMQLWLFRQRCTMYMKAVRHWMKSGEGVILDRSLFSDHVFALVNNSDGFISNEGYRHYCSLRKQVLNLVPFPHMVVYLDVAPEVCQERISKRGRDCESGIPTEYLSSLDVGYKHLLEEMRGQGCEIFSYDWSEYGYSFEVDKDIMNVSGAAINLDETTYESINRSINDVFNMDPSICDESNSEAIDDHILNKQEIKAHSDETKRTNYTKI